MGSIHEEKKIRGRKSYATVPLRNLKENKSYLIWDKIRLIGHRNVIIKIPK
jgi:hypothetical protein